MFRLHVPARAAFVYGANKLMLLLTQHRPLVRQGSAWVGGREKGAKTNNVCVVVFFCGSAGFGQVQQGLVGLKTQGHLVAKKRRPPGSCSGNTKNRFLCFNPGGHSDEDPRGGTRASSSLSRADFDNSAG